MANPSCLVSWGASAAGGGQHLQPWSPGGPVVAVRRQGDTTLRVKGEKSTRKCPLGSLGRVETCSYGKAVALRKKADLASPWPSEIRSSFRVFS